jgi:hypothetical protein
MPAWPLKLTNGDEISVTGLIAAPLLSWTVAVDRDILRLHFVHDVTSRTRLRALLAAADMLRQRRL